MPKTAISQVDDSLRSILFGSITIPVIQDQKLSPYLCNRLHIMAKNFVSGLVIDSAFGCTCQVLKKAFNRATALQKQYPKCLFALSFHLTYTMFLNSKML